jgi:hypothetical protein
MAILKYIPPKRVINDRRTPDGGYYEAKCEHCDTLFYPKRKTAMYCSNSCTVSAYREKRAKQKLEYVAILTAGKLKIADYFSEYKLKSFIKEILSDNYPEVGESGLLYYDTTDENSKQYAVLKKYRVKRISAYKYELQKLTYI